MHAGDAARRAWIRWRPPSVGSALFVLLLLGITVVSLAASWRMHRSWQERRRATDLALEGFAKYAARAFIQQALDEHIAWRARATTLAIGEPVTDAAAALSLEEYVARAQLALGGRTVGAEDPLLGFFRYVPRRGRYDAVGGATEPAVREIVMDAIADAGDDLASDLGPNYRVVPLRDARLFVVMDAQVTAEGDEVAVFGVVGDRTTAWASFAERVHMELPASPLPLIEAASAESAETAADSLVAIQVFDPRGELLYASTRRFEGSITSEVRYGREPANYRVVATLHPGLVEVIRERLDVTRRESLRIPLGVGAARIEFGIPLETFLPLLSILLAVAAAVHLWRERSLIRARRDFVASVSHELRTPLAQIRMFTETLQLGRARDDDERSQWLNIIGREARRLGDLVENILLFSHIDADRAKIEKERTDLGELIEEVVESFVPVAAQRRMQLLADAPSRIFVLVDPRAMRQIIVNLVDNALKYGPPGQKVTVELERIGNTARLSVSDQGPGIPVADRKRMWEPFVRLGSAGGTTAGSGIGLAVVRGLVEQHGATITVTDNEGGGSRFVMEIPTQDSIEGLPPRATGEFRTLRVPPRELVTGETPRARATGETPRAHTTGETPRASITSSS